MIQNHEDRTGRAMPIDSLIIFANFRFPRALSTARARKGGKESSHQRAVYDYPPAGIRGVFSPAEINEILQLTQRLAA
jgi:hypothetical protein